MLRRWSATSGVLLLALGCTAGSTNDETSSSTTMGPGAGSDGEPSGPPASTDGGDGSGPPTSDPMGTDGPGSSGGSTGGADCEYPPGAVEPMALDEVLSPYSWGRAIHGDGTMAALDLAHAPCDDDPIIDWSPHDVLVFVSIPAW